MFCKNCGKFLGPNDKYCSNCGQKVERESEPFVPAFMKDNEEHKGFEKRETPRKPVERETFDWNLEGFPTANKKTEDVDFNWSAVIEENQRKIYHFHDEEAKSEKSDKYSESETADEEAAGEGTVDEEAAGEDTAISGSVTAAEETETVKEAEEILTDKAGQDTEDTLADELPEEKEKTLEEELFGEMMFKKPEPAEEAGQTIAVVKNRAGAENIDKFYTYNKKKSELQALLDQEYKRLEEMNRTEEKVPKLDDLLAMGKAETEITATPEKAEDGAPVFVGVQWAAAPKGVYVIQEVPESKKAEEESGKQPQAEKELPPSGKAPSEDAKAETVCRETEEKDERKLTFSDVFNSDDDDDDENSEKGGCLKIIGIILCVILLLQVGIIGIQYFLPDSAVAQKINEGYGKILSLINKDDVAEAQTDDEIMAASLEKAITKGLEFNKNISSVRSDATLKFEEGNDYGFENLGNGYTYKDEPWFTDETGNEVTYYEGLVGTLVQFYSAWVDKMDDNSDDILLYIDSASDFYSEIAALETDEDVAYSIEELRIGEIKSDGKGFYVMTAVTKVSTADSEKIKEQQIVYMEPDNEIIKISDMKTL